MEPNLKFFITYVLEVFQWLATSQNLPGVQARRRFFGGVGVGVDVDVDGGLFLSLNLLILILYIV